MVIDETAAAYGLFQIAFAEADEHFRALLSHLICPENPENAMDRVPWNLADVIKTLRKELGVFKGRGASIEEFADKVKEACSRMKLLSKWRNVRIHSHIRRSNNGAYVLVDKTTDKALSMNVTEITDKIDCAISITTTVIAYSTHLLGVFDFDRENQRMVDADPELKKVFGGSD